jgi:short chain dehydrogenase
MTTCRRPGQRPHHVTIFSPVLCCICSEASPFRILLLTTNQRIQPVTTPKTNQTWFVTGASKGLGLTLVRRLLSQGYSVAATSRNLPELQQAVRP